MAAELNFLLVQAERNPVLQAIYLRYFLTFGCQVRVGVGVGGGGVDGCVWGGGERAAVRASLSLTLPLDAARS